MILLSSLISAFETELLAQYRNVLLPGHRRALDAMKACRTALSPRMQAQCPACDHQTFRGPDLALQLSCKALAKILIEFNRKQAEYRNRY
jgi:hypothetical protein